MPADPCPERARAPRSPALRSRYASSRRVCDRPSATSRRAVARCSDARLDDVRIRAAAAKIAADSDAYLLFARPRLASQQRGECHHLARSAVPALVRVGGEKCFLQRLHLPRGTVDRLELLALARDREREAGGRRMPADEDR